MLRLKDLCLSAIVRDDFPAFIYILFFTKFNIHFRQTFTHFKGDDERQTKYIQM